MTDAQAQTVAAGEHGHAPGGHVYAHQFDSIAQQHEAVTLGMWAFLVTEIMFFGGLFASLFVYRGVYPDDFMQTGRELDWLMGAINTGVLLCSSLTMALAVRSAQLHWRRGVAAFLLLTMALGAAFLVVKGFEYARHLNPLEPEHYAFAAHHPPHHRLFYAFYFIMTGVHALHMVAGIGVMVWLLASAYRAPLNEVYPHRFEMTGLYWHFVDIVWIFLYPILYLSYH